MGHLARVRTFAPALVIALLLAWPAWPALRWLWGEWWSNDAYAHGPLIPLISLFLAMRQAGRVSGGALARPGIHGSSQKQATVLSLALVVCSLGGLLWAMTAKAFFLAILILIPLIAGLVWYLVGWDALRRLAFAIGYLSLAVPLPVVDLLSTPLQGLTVRVSTALARTVGIPATNEGSRVILSTCDLDVGAPCSGLYSLVALLALAALMAHILEGRGWARVALVVLAVPVALLANATRVFALLVVAERWGAEVALGLWHDWSGLAFFGLAVLLLTLLGGWLGCRTVRSDI
jgi:exosortase